MLQVWTRVVCAGPREPALLGVSCGDVFGRGDERRVRAKDVPAAIVVVTTTLTLLRLAPRVLLPYALWGLVVAWIYLRFYQPRDGRVGDMSEAFAFASFFPDVLQPMVSRASTPVYRVFVFLRLCRKSPSQLPTTAPRHRTGSALRLPGMDAADAERR